MQWPYERGRAIQSAVHRGRLKLGTPGPDLVLGLQGPPLITQSFPPPLLAPPTFFNTPLRVQQRWGQLLKQIRGNCLPLTTLDVKMGLE